MKLCGEQMRDFMLVRGGWLQADLWERTPGPAHWALQPVCVLESCCEQRSEEGRVCQEEQTCTVLLRAIARKGKGD